MPTIEEIRQKIRITVETVTGRTTIIANSDTDQPTGPYCTVLLMDDNFFPHDIVTRIDNYNEKVRGLGSFAFSVQAIGGDPAAGTGPHEVLKKLKNSFSSNNIVLTLADEGIGISSVGKIMDTPIEVGGSIEQRSSLTVTASASSPNEFAVDMADDVEIELTGDGKQPSVTITIPPPEVVCGQ